MPDRSKQIHALQLLFLLIPDSNYQLLKDTLLLLHETVQEVRGFIVCSTDMALTSFYVLSLSLGIRDYHN